MRFPGIAIGLSHTISHTVSHRDTVGNFFPDDLQPMLSTPGLMALAIQASSALVDPLLPDDFTSVGKSASVTHEQPSVLGAALSLTVTITHFDGYHITLSMVASDHSGVVGTGSLVRSIVNKQWLQLKIARRAAEV